MSILQFQDEQDICIFDNGDNPLLVKHTPVRNGELIWIVLLFYLQGSPSGDLRVNVFSAEDQTSAIATSNWVAVSDFKTETSDKISEVRFDFNRENLSSSSQYTLQLESRNYTRNANTDFISFCCQQVNEPNTNAGGAVYSLLLSPATFKQFIRS